MPALRAKVLATLAHSESERGRVAPGLALLDRARRLAATVDDAELNGILHGQTALLLLRRGAVDEAAVHFAAALRALPAGSGQRPVVLLNSSAANLVRGDVRAAQADIADGLAAVHPDDRMLRAKLRHNGGYVAFLQADIPAALRAYEEAGALAGDAVGYRAEIGLDRARALNDAGLLVEADLELDSVVAAFSTQSLDQDLAEAELLQAEIALRQGRPDQAADKAREARRRLRRRRNDTWAMLADLLLVQASVARGAATVALGARAAAIGAGLADVGLTGDAVTATLLATRIAVRTGEHPPLPRLPPVERMTNRLLARLVRHEIRRDRDGGTGGAAELKAGLRELHRYRARFGSLDLASAAALHGQELVRLGLRSAVADGRPSVVHDWVERTRAASLRLTPVRPPIDPQAAAELAELRAVRAAQRAAELGGSADPALDVRRAHLERAVRQRAWLVDGAAAASDRIQRLGEVRGVLGDGCLVSFVAVDGAITALVATARAARVVPLAATDEVLPDLRRVRSDLDAAAQAVLPAPLRASVLASLAAGLGRLESHLWRPLARWTADGPVVIVPTGSLAAVPWPLLAGLRGRPVTVAPSATWWLAHRHPPRSGSSRVVVAAGPGLRRADEEAEAVAMQWPSSTTLLGAAATVEAVLADAGTAGVLHLAAHGRHEPDNPLFSALELADGPLFGHDLPRAAALPPHVVLSACDLGLVVERPGDESLGMTSALLHGGVSSVVAGVARVNDDVACQLMIAYHEALRAGRTPSAALAEALGATGSDRSERPAPFVVIGAGW